MSKRPNTVGHSFDRASDRCECGGEWTYFDADSKSERGYGCENSDGPHVPPRDTNGRPIKRRESGQIYIIHTNTNGRTS
jgi:hypothetical protein